MFHSENDSWSRAISHLTLILGLLVFTLTAMSPNVRGMSDSCPNVCLCKWKSGKRTVECTDRELITIAQGVDSETQVLDMSRNNLQALPAEIFAKSSLLNLQKLFLRNCRLGQIDDKALKGLKNLVELDLSNNLLTSVPPALQDVTSLRELSLARNPIAKVGPQAFSGVPALIKLDLSYCELQAISSNAFKNVESLEYLKLNGNKLRELRSNTVDVLTELHGIELHDNPWFCDCHLRPAIVWLTNHNIPYYVPPICEAGPVKFKAHTFSELTVEDFACRPDIRAGSKSERSIKGFVGENGTILCRVYSEPIARISWHWAGRLLTNDSPFTAQQRVYILEDRPGSDFEQVSSLTITNLQETTSGGFHCVAKNNAGTAETNFTLHVTKRVSGSLLAGSGHIAGLGAAIITLIVLVLFGICYVFVRMRRDSFQNSKSPASIEILPNGALTRNKCVSITPVIETSSFTEKGAPPSALRTAYPAQNPGDSPTCVNNYDIAPLSFFHASNPDLINDTKSHIGGINRSDSSEYARMNDYLYPKALWNPNEAFCEHLTGLNHNFDTNDKTPIIPDEDAKESQTAPSEAQTKFGLQSQYGANSTTLPDAKTLRVWQKGVQVLPPVSTLKKTLSRNFSPSEFQEGCSTDV